MTNINSISKSTEADAKGAPSSGQDEIIEEINDRVQGDHQDVVFSSTFKEEYGGKDE